LAEKRESADEVAPMQQSGSFHPSHPDPFAMFESFATHNITADSKVELVTTDWAEVMKLISLKTGLVYSGSLMELEDLPFLIGQLENGKKSKVSDILRLLPQIEPAAVVRTLAWLIKLGICRYHV
jgi:hypothetical protein